MDKFITSYIGKLSMFKSNDNDRKYEANKHDQYL